MINIVTFEDFEKFEKKLLNQISSINQKKEYISKEECFKIFGIKERTLTTLRDRREISFSKVGNSCFYKYSSIEQYFKKNTIEAIA
jgi:hypothetical protein